MTKKLNSDGKAKRRTKGEGSIYPKISKEDPNKILYWVVQCTVTDENGQKIKKTFSHKLKREAIRKRDIYLEELKKKKEAGLDPEVWTVANWLHHWLRVFKVPTIELKTIASYDSTIRNHINPAIGAMKLTELLPMHLNIMFNKINSQRNREISKTILNQALREAVKNKKVQNNVMTQVDVPAYKKPLAELEAEQHPKSLDEFEVMRFLNAAALERLGILFATQMSVGLRVGEVIALNWADVDLNNKRIYIKKTTQRVKKLDPLPDENKTVVVTKRPKTSASIRSIPILDEIAIQALRRWKCQLEFEAETSGKEMSELVFPSRNGTALELSTVYEAFRRICKAANIELPKNTKTHAMRHSFLSKMVELNHIVPLKTLQAWAGHTTPKMILEKYSHPHKTVEERAIAELQGGILTRAKEIACAPEATSHN